MTERRRGHLRLAQPGEVPPEDVFDKANEFAMEFDGSANEGRPEEPTPVLDEAWSSLQGILKGSN